MAGLSSFVGGLATGYGLGKGFKEDFREGQDRRERQKITQEAKEKFGGLDDEAYLYMADRYAGVLAETGDIEGATSWLDFAKDRKTRAGADLFAEGLVDLNRGNYDAFFEKANKLGKLNGYGDQYELSGKPEPHYGEDGQMQGFRVTFKDGDGKEYRQDIPIDKLGDFYSTTVSPQAAFEATRARKVAEQGRKAELEDFATKEKIKARTGRPKERREGKADSYDAAVDALKDSIDYQDASPEDQRRMVNDQARQRERFVGGRGRQSPGIMGGDRPEPGPRAGLVNRETGETVPLSEIERQEQATPSPGQPEPMRAPETGVGGAHEAAAPAPTRNFDAMRAALEERAAHIRGQHMDASVTPPTPRARPAASGLGIASAGAPGIRGRDREQRSYR